MNSSIIIIEELTRRVVSLEERIGGLNQTSVSPTEVEVLATDLDIVWIIISAIMVFFMQVGFAMLEVGSVHPKNTKAVLLKNICDASLGALSWWLVGFAFAHGKDKHGFIGTDMFALVGGDPPLSDGVKEARWMFDWAFTATSVTIVSGAVAERVKISAYVIYSIVLTGFIYPVVVHWAWQPDGWASPYRGSGDGISLLAGCGAADFAGSGVVHMVGGTAALVATVAVKPRLGRFKNGTVCRLPQQSPALQTLGTLILWVGWYAFNAGSSLAVSAGRSVVAARAAVATTIAPSAAVLVMVLALKIMENKYDTRGVNNGILAGLVAITAGAPLVDPEGAFVIGAVAAVVYYSAASLLLKFRVDDVVEASAVHLFGGIWGLVAAGLFATREGWDLAYGDDNDGVGKCCGLFYGCGFNLLFANLALIASILAWVGSTSIILFFSIEATIGLRIPASEEEYGMERFRQNSFTSVGSKKQGMDAVRRAITKAHLGYDESVYMGTSSRSYHGSRPESLSSSKHDELTAVGAVSNGKHDFAWGVGSRQNSKVERRIGPRPNVLGRQQSTRTETGLARGLSQVTSSEGGAEAVTTNTIRGTAVGSNSHNSGVGGRGFNAGPFPSPTSETVNRSGDDEGLESSCEEEKVHETPPLSTF